MIAGRVFLCAMLVSGQAMAADDVTSAGARGTVGAGAAHALARGDVWAALRSRVRYVFVLFQENRSFDQYFGTYPGANGLFATFPGADMADPMQAPAKAGGSFSQPIRDVDGRFSATTPFLMPRTIVNAAGRVVALYPEDTQSVDHSHRGMVGSMHLDHGTMRIAKNDAYVLTNERLHFAGDASDAASVVTKDGVPAAQSAAPSLALKQAGELMVGHLDCDTIPFLWRYADRFALFDNFHQTTIGPSTPNAIAMIAGQTGETQWALHPGSTGAALGGELVPNVTDSAPFSGSNLDISPGPKPPYGPDEQVFDQPLREAALPPADGTLTTVRLKAGAGKYNGSPKLAAQPSLTFASLPLSFMGSAAPGILKQDENAAADLADVKADIGVISGRKGEVPWAWYQQGYGPEPFDGHATVALSPASTPHSSYIVHHNGPQYFGYLGDNPAEQAHMHGLQAFFDDVRNGSLSPEGGVIYVRGGYYNNDELRTLDPNPNVRAVFAGNDDHPGYSDAQISEALVAGEVNAIASSRYWDQSAIVITYDETDGLYDHVPERIRSWGPDGLPLAGGPRIPAILVSPYAAAHVVSHVYSEHSSVIRFIDRLFGLVPLADLPDERRGRAAGQANARLAAPDGSAQRDLGPADDGVPMGDLSEAFDLDRLLGRAPELSADYATIDGVRHLPHADGAGCKALGIVPTDYPHGLAAPESDPPPPDFNPRPIVSPGVPSDPAWQN